MRSMDYTNGLPEPGDYRSHGHTSTPAAPAEPMAIVGMAMRLPGQVSDENEFWDFLVEKRSGLCNVPKDRYNVAGFHDPSGKPGTFKQDKAYFLDQVDLHQFDTSVFPLSKTELERLDPQQRQLLEVAYECFENAGETCWKGSKTGCYVGVFTEDWQDLNAKETQHRGGYRVTGYGDFVLGNRISYEMNLHGPSMTIKTGCSSSLVGLDMACEAIRKGDADGALVCGVNLIFSPTMTMALSDQGVLSPEGVCKTFDASANGYGRGEAVNAIYIKKLSDAISNGDKIRAVIRGTSVNCDGKTQGMLIPSPVAQETLIRQAYQQGGITDLSETAFVECHGTGTPVGDPLETRAVANCFGTQGVVITSVKPNVGHSEGAAGITSLIKAVLAIEHRQIPPNIHFENPNRDIPFESCKLHVPTSVEQWPHGRAERASVNSFGIGGVNAHVVLESLQQYGTYNPKFTQPIQRGPAPVEISDSNSLLVFSAENEASARETADTYQQYLQSSNVSLADVAHTLAMRRVPKSFRSFALVGKMGGRLEYQAAEPAEAPSTLPAMGWVFTGQGAQWPEMGAELIDTNAVFRQTIHELDDFLRSLPSPPPWSIEEELRKTSEDSRVSQAEFGHPMSIAVQIGLVNVLRSWDIHPDFVLGHSSGEMAAAYACGAITATGAMAAATFRGTTSTDEKPGGKPRGAMAAIGLGSREVEPYMEPGVVIACENSQCSVTVSGDTDQVAKVVENVKENQPGVLARFLRVEKAFHSHHMKEYGPSYEKHIQPFVRSIDPTIPFYSSVTGKRLTGDGCLDGHYWRQNMESPVRFNSAMRQALRDVLLDNTVLVEVGPHPALKGPIGQIVRDVGFAGLTHVGTLERNKICSDSILTTAGKLFQHGCPPDMSAVCSTGKLMTGLPGYRWKRDAAAHWAESRLASQFRFRDFKPHDLLGVRVVEVFNESCWRAKLVLDDLPWLSGHNVDGQIVLPGAAYICMAGEAIAQLAGVSTYSLQNVSITAGLLLEYGKPVELVTRLTPHAADSSDEAPLYQFSITSHDGSRWTKHCSGDIRAGIPDSVDQATQLPTALPRNVDSQQWYGVLKRVGFDYQSYFRGLDDISADTTAKRARATVLADNDDRTKYSLHPGVIDQCFQLFTVAACHGLGRNLRNVAVPTFIEEMVVSPPVEDGRALQVLAQVNSAERGSFTGELVAQSSGSLSLLLKGFKASAMTTAEDPDAELPLITAFEWRPHADFISMKDYMHPRTFIPAEWPLLEELMLLCMLDHQESIQLTKETPAHLVTLWNWMRDYISKYQAGQNVFLEKRSKFETWSQAERKERIQKIVDQVSTSIYDAFAIAIHRLFHQAEDIFNDKAHALHILMPDDVLTRLYANGDELLYGDAIAALGHTNPRMRILEVGAGTGGTTSKVLDALVNEHGERLYSTYTYTDVSAGFMTAAKQRFSDFPGIEYKVFDITKDPVEQGLVKEGYDLIIGYNVVHATPNLQVSLGNLRSLLSSDGRLFLQELCPDAKYINYIMGFLQGWWLGAKNGRAEEPYISPARWTEELQLAGFKTAEAVLDGVAPYQQSAGIMAKVDNGSTKPDRVSLLTHEQNGSHVKAVKDVLEARGVEVDICVFGKALPAQNQHTISLLDLQKTMVHDMSEAEFQQLRDLLRGFSGSTTVWAMGSSQVACQDPRAAMSVGLLRTARNEWSLDLVTLELNVKEDAKQHAEAIVDLFLHVQAPTRSAAAMDPDREYALVDGKLCVPRLHWRTMDGAFKSGSGAQSTSAAASPVKYTKQISLQTPGLLHTMGWSEEALEPLTKGQLRVKTKAMGLNFRDVLIALGVLDNSAREIGLEGCGVVIEVPTGSASTFSVGDRVMYMSSGCFTTTMTVDESLCVKMDDSISFEEGAGLPCVYATATMALADKGNLQPGQTVLIQSACGGVGLAAVQIAQMLGAEVYCTVSSKEKRQYLVDNHGIPEERIFNSRDASFLRDIMRVTAGRGVDVVLNSLSGDLLRASWDCVADFGCMIEIGKRDFRRRAKLSMEAFEQNRTFIGLDLWQVSQVRPEQAAAYLSRCVGWIRDGKIKTGAIAKTFAAEQMQEAFRFMQGGRHIGKIIITMPEDDSSLSSTRTRPSPKLRKDRSYMLVGGLGGLGRSLASWMAENGAGEIVFMSRSARAGSEVDSYVKELSSHGCEVHLAKGNVSVEQDVRNAVAAAQKPLAGVINLSMVLRDVNLDNMTYKDWTEAVLPKVQGTWNLDKAIDTKLDFFILCSSYSGIVGQWGQANYAAANTFLNAFVQYRHSKGLAASVIDIGVMGEVGFVSQNKDILNLFQKSGMHILREQNLLDAFHLAMHKSAPSSAAEVSMKEAYTASGQILLGLVTTIPVSSPNNRVVWKDDIRMSIYHNMSQGDDDQSQATNQQDGVSLLLESITASPSLLDEDETKESIAKAVASALARFLIKSEDSINITLSPDKIGIDSLVAMELRNWIRQRFGVDSSVMMIVQSASLLALAEHISQGLAEKLAK